MVVDETIKKEDLFRYSYYNKNGVLIGVLDIENLKKILNVDEVVLEENYSEND